MAAWPVCREGFAEAVRDFQRVLLPSLRRSHVSTFVLTISLLCNIVFLNFIYGLEIVRGFVRQRWDRRGPCDHVYPRGSKTWLKNKKNKLSERSFMTFYGNTVPSTWWLRSRSFTTSRLRAPAGARRHARCTRTSEPPRRRESPRSLRSPFTMFHKKQQQIKGSLSCCLLCALLVHGICVVTFLSDVCHSLCLCPGPPGTL